MGMIVTRRNDKPGITLIIGFIFLRMILKATAIAKTISSMIKQISGPLAKSK